MNFSVLGSSESCLSLLSSPSTFSPWASSCWTELSLMLGGIFWPSLSYLSAGTDEWFYVCALGSVFILTCLLSKADGLSSRMLSLPIVMVSGFVLAHLVCFAMTTATSDVDSGGSYKALSTSLLCYCSKCLLLLPIFALLSEFTECSPTSISSIFFNSFLLSHSI